MHIKNMTKEDSKVKIICYEIDCKTKLRQKFVP
jgi:hypothetical protein